MLSVHALDEDALELVLSVEKYCDATVSVEEYIFEESRVYKDQQVRNESAGVKQQNKTYAQASAGTAAH